MFVVIYLRRPDSALKLATAECFQHDLHGNYPVFNGFGMGIWKQTAQLNDINLCYESYAYWTVHHLDIWKKVDQLDDTCFIIYC